MIEFPYGRAKSELLGEITRPIAPIEIKGPSGEWFPAIMYIDSGADISLVPLDFGSLLGLQAQRAEGALRGIGGEAVELVLRSVSMRLNRVVVRSKIAVALTNEVPYLLGRYDVFNLFRITFEERKQRVLFEKI